tara:strand:+ start:25649 stop:26266 length:618 start_codon:yes stop_codon:yes gene_type:complete
MLKNKPNPSVVILAAGASKRMGTPKQLLKWGENTLLEHAILVALQLNSQEIIVVLGANYELIKKTIKQYPITILNNKDWEKGLGTSIAFATQYLMKSKHKIDGVLIALADQPLMDVHFLENLIDKFELNKNKIIATFYEDKTYGVPVIFGASYFDELSKLSNDKGAKQLLKTHKKHVKGFVPKNKNVDLDSKEDYEQLYKATFDA